MACFLQSFRFFILYSCAVLVLLAVLRYNRRRAQSALTWLTDSCKQRFLAWWLEHLYLVADDKMLYYAVLSFIVYTV